MMDIIGQFSNRYVILYRDTNYNNSEHYIVETHMEDRLHRCSFKTRRDAVLVIELFNSVLEDSSIIDSLSNNQMRVLGILLCGKVANREDMEKSFKGVLNSVNLRRAQVERRRKKCKDIELEIIPCHNGMYIVKRIRALSGITVDSLHMARQVLTTAELILSKRSVTHCSRAVQKCVDKLLNLKQEETEETVHRRDRYAVYR